MSQIPDTVLTGLIVAILAGATFGLVVLGVLIGRVSFNRHRRVAEPDATSSNSSRFPKLALLVFLSVVVIGVAALVIVLYFDLALHLDQTPATPVVEKLEQPPAVAIHDSQDDTSEPVDADDTSESIPKWVSEPPRKQNGIELVVVSSKQQATAEEAEAQALDQAANQIARYILTEESVSPSVFWRPSTDLVSKHAVRQRYVETATRDFGTFTAPMHRVYLQIELSRAVADVFRPVYRVEQVRHRLIQWGSVSAAIVFFLAVISGYLRIDAWTHGAYRGRLRLMAVSFVAIAIALVLVLA